MTPNKKCKNWIQQCTVLLGNIVTSVSKNRHTTQRDITLIRWIVMGNSRASYYCRILSSNDMSKNTKEQCTVLLGMSTTERTSELFWKMLGKTIPFSMH
jgi:hypothetical protein